MENPMNKWDDLGGPSLFLETPIWRRKLKFGNAHLETPIWKQPKYIKKTGPSGDDCNLGRGEQPNLTSCLLSLT